MRWNRAVLVNRFPRKFNDQVHIVGSIVVLQDRLCAHTLAAALALVQDDVGLLGVRINADRSEQALAGVGAISRIDVEVSAPEAERTMIAWGRLCGGWHFLAAMNTNKGLVYDLDSFDLQGHKSSGNDITVVEWG